MNVSLSWLNDHLDLAGKSIEELDDLLTFSGIEVEGLQSQPDNLVVGQISSSEPHPDADKLSVCKVDDGSGTPRQIVCGAKNYQVGDKVPLALPGCQLAPDFKIKAGKLRGVPSDGMLCSASELGMPDEVDGLLILPADLAPGTPIGDVFPPIFELEITPNRPDCLSHLGVARELSVLTKQSLKGADAHRDAGVATRTANDSEVAIRDLEACPLYTARRITGVKVAESPAWLKQKLTSVGLRPINNIVDITNFVLLEMGQPLHAFDADKLDGGIVVRPAADGEKFLALDGDTYPLLPEDLVIADQNQAVAIAGVMGGELTGVTETTTDVLLEAAYFKPQGIRRTSRRLDLSSDSSYRFERGVDSQQVAGASALATKLILELAGGEAADELIVCGAAPELSGTVEFDIDRCRSLLGAEIEESEVEQILTGLGLAKIDTANWKVPSYRLDLKRHVDLVEEIARVYNIDRIPATFAASFSEIGKVDLEYDYNIDLSRQLAANGFYEARTIKFISENQIADDLCSGGGERDLVRMRNPMNEDFTVMRPSLIPALLAVAERNVRMGNTSLRFFETGMVFDGEVEAERLALLISGSAAPASWHDAKPADADLFELRGVLELISPKLALAPSSQNDGLVVAADIVIGKRKVGTAGQAWPARVRAMDLRTPVYVAEIDLAALRQMTGGGLKQVEPLPKFPAMTRDIAMELAREIPNIDLHKFFTKVQRNEKLLVDFSLFDVFVDDAGVKLSTDKKSIAYSLTYRDKLRTLESAEVDAAHGKILESLQKELPVKLR
ncbi:MAG: phenylalanyl-tRNA synthetase beta chain [Verrucomicrobiales bacterium]|jgi:phenylalanyl-tRNA synthetase beta chain